MNRAALLFVAALVIAGTQAEAAGRNPAPAAETGTETVLVTYRVKPGKEEELLKVLRQQWTEVRKANLVQAEPHILVRGTDEAKKPYFVEIFTWVSHEAPDHAPAAVQSVWALMAPLVEERDGHRGIEFPEVQTVPADSK